MGNTNQKHYITLLDGRQVRAEFNLEVYSEILAQIGQARFDELAKGTVDIAAFMIIYRAMVKAGEALEGRIFSLTSLELGRLISFPQMAALKEIILDFGERPKGNLMKVYTS